MTRTTSIKTYIRLGLIIGFFAFMIALAFFQTKALSEGVTLKISGLQNGEMTDQGIVSLSGSAKHAKHLIINGREVVVNQENNFTEELVLSPGYNIVTVEAEDRYAKKTEATYKVFFDDKEGDVALLGQKNVSLQNKN